MLKFSLMIPTRKRPQQLRRFLKSIYDTATNMNDIEIHFGVDDDDTDTLNLTTQFLEEQPTYKLYRHIRHRGNSIVHHYVNWLATFCKGEYIITLNDDCLFRYKNWDVNVYKRLETYLKDKPDGLLLGVGNDITSTQKTPFLTTGFPLLTRKGVELLGFFLDPEFIDVTSDEDICKLYANIGRVVDLRDILVIHHRPEGFSKLDGDYTYYNDTKGIIDTVKHVSKESRRTTGKDLGFDERISFLVHYILNERK